MDENGSVKKHDFYALTKNGESKLNKCKGRIHHLDCSRNLIYVSYKKHVNFTEGPLKITHEEFEIDDDDPLDITYNIPHKVIETFMERAQMVHKKTLAFLAGHKDGNNVTVSHIIIPTTKEQSETSKGNKCFIHAYHLIFRKQYVTNYFDFYRSFCQ